MVSDLKNIVGVAVDTIQAFLTSEKPITHINAMTQVFFSENLRSSYV